MQSAQVAVSAQIFNAGETVLEEGDEPAYYCLIVSGTFGAHRGGECLQALAAGQPFGDFALLSEELLAESLVAHTEGTLLMLSGRDWCSIMRGGLSAALEEKLLFLLSLPQFRGSGELYVRRNVLPALQARPLLLSLPQSPRLGSSACRGTFCRHCGCTCEAAVGCAAGALATHPLAVPSRYPRTGFCRLTSTRYRSHHFTAKLQATERMQEYMFEPKDIIVSQGDPADCMYILRSGQAVVVVDPDFVPGSGAKPAEMSKCLQVCLSPPCRVRACKWGACCLPGTMCMILVFAGCAARCAWRWQLCGRHDLHPGNCCHHQDSDGGGHDTGDRAASEQRLLPAGRVVGCARAHEGGDRSEGQTDRKDDR